MSIDLPKPGQANWGYDLNEDLTTLNDKLDQGLSVTDSLLAENLADPESASASVLSATFVGVKFVDLESFLLHGELMPDDGVTDARPLLQRALDTAAAAIPMAGPVTIRIPPGRFRIDSSVRWYTGYHVGFSGAGRDQTRILPQGTAVFGLIDPSFDITTFLDNQVFADMTIDCIGQVAEPNQVGTKGIALRYMRDAIFQRVRILDSWATSFGCDYLQNVSFVDCTAIRSGRGVVGFDSFGAGFGIGVGEFDREVVTFENCHAVDCHSSGFFVERLRVVATPADARGFTLTACTASGCYNGFREAGGDGVIVVGCHFIGNSNAGIHVDGYSLEGRHGGSNGNVSQSVIKGNGVGVLIGNASLGSYTFQNNEITDNVGAGCSSATGGQIGPGWRWIDNRIERNGAGGISLGSTLVGRPEIIGNVIRENGTGDGIRIVGDAYEPRILNNRIQGHKGAGVALVGADMFLTDPEIRGNTITENSAGPIVNAKVTNSTTLIQGNREAPSFATITNVFITPSFEVDVTQAVPLSRLDAATRKSAGGARFGTYYAELIVNQAGSASARVARRTAPMSGVWTLSAWVRASESAIIRPYVTGWWDSSANQRSWHQGGVRATGGWQRVCVTALLPANGSRIDLNIALDGAAVGNSLHVDGVMITSGSVLWPYIDGDQPNCAWSGTPHASASVLTIPA